MFKEPNIIFHHIPKCGGTSIVTGLAMTYYPLRLLTKGRKGFKGQLNAPQTTAEAEKQGVHVYDYRRKLLAQHIESGDIPLISGHYPVNHEIIKANRLDWKFITLLRNPLDRWYSEYYWNRHKDHEYRKTDLSIEEYFETEAGKTNARSFVNFFADTNEFVKTPSQEEVKSAMETLGIFDVVGCLEDLEKFRSDMKRVLGRKPFFLNRNTSPAPEDKQPRPDENSDFHKALMEALAADFVIYEIMRGL